MAILLSQLYSKYLAVLKATYVHIIIMEIANIDWDSCIICNKSNGELRCPVDSLQQNGMTIYRNFLDAVNDFRSLDALPTSQKFEGENLAELFYQNKAKITNLVTLSLHPQN